MSVQDTIENKLQSDINVNYLDVVNESYMHNVPEGSESHFKVTIVSDEFADMSLINRHRRVNEVLASELQNNIHALSIHAYTQAEWQEKNEQAPESPPCLGGGK